LLIGIKSIIAFKILIDESTSSIILHTIIEKLNKHIINIREKVVRYKTLIQNFSYLSALQIFNLLLPLITYPYLIRVLGKETYGLVVFAQAIIGYLLILVGFGFNMSATKDVSIHRDNKEKLSEIVSSVLIIKSVFFIISLIILVVVLWLIPQVKDYKLLFYLTMWMCLYDVLFPQWYFQGIEQMKFITYITLVSRLIFFGLIFVFIHSPSDYLFMPVISGLGAIIAGLISLYIIFYIHRIQFSKQPLPVLKKYFKESIPIFVSNVSIKLYGSTNKVLVGAFIGMAEIAYYDLAEKIVSVIKLPQSIVGQTIFPKISRDKNLQFVKKYFYISLIINVILTGLTVAFTKPIILLLGGSTMLDAKYIVWILVFTTPFVAMSNIWGFQLLIPFGYNKAFQKVILSSSFVYIILMISIWQLYYFSIINISLVNLIIEIFVAFGFLYQCKKNNLWRKI